jgi:hypothetical protein
MISPIEHLLSYDFKSTGDDRYSDSDSDSEEHNINAGAGGYYTMISKRRRRTGIAIGR